MAYKSPLIGAQTRADAVTGVPGNAYSLALSARAYHRTLKVARTIADIDGADGVRRIHIAEALSLKRQWATAEGAGFAKVS